jgi:hypothetical protein
MISLNPNNTVRSDNMNRCREVNIGLCKDYRSPGIDELITAFNRDVGLI